MVRTVEVLACEMADAYDVLTQALSGLTDAEFTWEPVDGRHTAQGSGLALSDGSGPHDLVLTWRDISACPGT